MRAAHFVLPGKGSRRGVLLDMGSVKHQIIDQQIADGPHCIPCGEEAPDCECPRRFLLMGAKSNQEALKTALLAVDIDTDTNAP